MAGENLAEMKKNDVAMSLSRDFDLISWLSAKQEYTPVAQLTKALRAAVASLTLTLNLT